MGQIPQDLFTSTLQSVQVLTCCSTVVDFDRCHGELLASLPPGVQLGDVLQPLSVRHPSTNFRLDGMRERLCERDLKIARGGALELLRELREQTIGRHYKSAIRVIERIIAFEHASEFDHEQLDLDHDRLYFDLADCHEHQAQLMIDTARGQCDERDVSTELQAMETHVNDGNTALAGAIMVHGNFIGLHSLGTDENEVRRIRREGHRSEAARLQHEYIVDTHGPDAELYEVDYPVRRDAYGQVMQANHYADTRGGPAIEFADIMRDDMPRIVQQARTRALEIQSAGFRSFVSPRDPEPVRDHPLVLFAEQTTRELPVLIMGDSHIGNVDGDYVQAADILTLRHLSSWVIRMTTKARVRNSIMPPQQALGNTYTQSSIKDGRRQLIEVADTAIQGQDEQCTTSAEPQSCVPNPSTMLTSCCVSRADDCFYAQYMQLLSQGTAIDPGSLHNMCQQNSPPEFAWAAMENNLRR